MRGGNRVDLKQETATKPRDGVDAQNGDHEDLAGDVASPTEAKQDEAEEEEIFDPETAGRETLLAKYNDLEERLVKAEDRVLRAVADAENYRKRLQREKEEQTRYANEAILRDLLPVIDNLERAVDHSQAGSEQDGVAEGLNMTLKGFLDSLARFGCTPVDAVGRIFDPNYHEAVSQEESENHEANTVIRELQKGYMLKDRLLRPAMVIVSKSPSQGEESTSREAEGTIVERQTGRVKVRVKKS
jgi:molecular chaperone GrpE